MRRSSGYTKVELLVVLAVLVVLLVVVTLMMSAQWRESQRVRDGERLGEIHEAMSTFAQGNRDRYPIPGLIWREMSFGEAQPAGMPEGRYLPISIPPDETKDTTANLYSLLIAREYLTSDLPVSPRERNPNVKRIPSYDYSEYDPTSNVYWDTAFKADLNTESHTSYAHQLLHGARKRLRWRNTQDSNAPILSNRGPRDGLNDPNSFTTRRDGSWAGFIAFADNSVHWSQTVTPKNVRYEPNHRNPARSSIVPDNIFAAEFDDEWPSSPLGSNDAYLAFTLEMVERARNTTPVIQHD